MTTRIQAEHDLSPIELSSLEKRLHNDNRRATGCADDRGLAFVIRDGAGHAIGVAAGYSWASTSELTLMWIDEAYRGRGYARQLLSALSLRQPFEESGEFGSPATTSRHRASTRRLASGASPNSRNGPKATPTSSFVKR